MAKMDFAVAPSVSISRSKFIRPSQHKTSMKLGEITPIFIDEVLPGDTRKIDMASLIRMNTPVAPIMDNIHMDYYAFYCPNRLLWSHWKEFMGENNTSAGIYSGTEYLIPTSDLYTNGVSLGSLGDHLGLPILSASASLHAAVSDLPGRMYKIVYNEWFRDQNLISPVSVSLGDTGAINYNMSLYKAAKTSDYFTRSLPYVQKGAPVTIPLGASAPIFGTGNALKFIGRDTAGTFPINLTTGSSSIAGNNQFGNADLYNRSGTTIPGHEALRFPTKLEANNESALYADLSQATAATINQLRFAFQYQKLLEKDALYGTRYWEVLKAHFGVEAPDASLQRPELLGHIRQRINIDQVISTTGIDQSTPGSNELGQTAAVSVSGDRGSIVTKSFTEHGYIMILAVARHDQTYGQGIAREWTRSKRTDYYFPVFANLGAQAVKNKEIYLSGAAVTDEAAFGYQEAWAEYRYKPSIVSGTLRPNVVGLGYWTLANNFASLPTLSQSFIEQDRSNLARAIGTFDQDFICDFYFKDIAVRPMPLYSVPGLIDHH